MPHGSSHPDPAVATPAFTLGAVLFDMDGTLVDSEVHWERAMFDLAAELDRPLPPDILTMVTGISVPDTARLLRDRLLPDGDVDRLESRLLELTAIRLAEGVLWQPGAEELLDAVRAAGLATALVTNSPRSILASSLPLLGAHRFDVTVCGDELPRQKPDPLPYIEAMRQLGVTAEQCLAIEDSPSGVQAAVDAGVPVLVVPSSAGAVVPEGPGRIFAASLLGATVEELTHLHAEFRRIAG